MLFTATQRGFGVGVGFGGCVGFDVGVAVGFGVGVGVEVGAWVGVAVAAAMIGACVGWAVCWVGGANAPTIPQVTQEKMRIPPIIERIIHRRRRDFFGGLGGGCWLHERYCCGWPYASVGCW